MLDSASIESLLNYVKNLQYPFAGNKEYRKQFFKNLEISNELSEKERLKDEDFIKYLEINSR